MVQKHIIAYNTIEFALTSWLIVAYWCHMASRVFVNIGLSNGLLPIWAPSHSCTWTNRLVSQMWAPLAACREPAGKLWQLCQVWYVFEHKTDIF